MEGAGWWDVGLLAPMVMLSPVPNLLVRIHKSSLPSGACKCPRAAFVRMSSYQSTQGAKGEGTERARHYLLYAQFLRNLLALHCIHTPSTLLALFKQMHQYTESLKFKVLYRSPPPILFESD